MPEATPSLLKSSHLLPWQHYVFCHCLSVCAHAELCVPQWTHTLHQLTAGHTAADFWGMWKGRDAVSLVSSQPYYCRLVCCTHNTQKRCVWVCAAVLCSLGQDWTCAGAGGSPFQACYLLLNKSAEGNGKQSKNGQRARERIKVRGLTSILAGNTAPWTRGEGQGDAPCLCEGHLSLRPVTMATCCAQCRGEGGDRGADTMATQAVTATALMGKGGLLFL